MASFTFQPLVGAWLLSRSVAGGKDEELHVLKGNFAALLQ